MSPGPTPPSLKPTPTTEPSSVDAPSPSPSSGSSRSSGSGADDESDSDPEGDEVATPEHCYYCFETLLAKLRPGQADEGLLESLSAPWKSDRFPLFVTWNARRPSSSSSSSHLRGCIGNFSPLALPSGLSEYALVSALKDRRFPPITTRELATLSCSVSLLHSFESGLDFLDWEVGKHGVHIFLDDPRTHPPPVDSARTSQSATPLEDQASSSAKSSSSSSSKGGGGGGGDVGGKSLKSRLMGVAAAKAARGNARQLSATYLPDVAVDQGWTKLETIDSAIRKAGYEGKITDAIRRTVRLERYQSSKVSVAYDDWADWRASKHRPL